MAKISILDKTYLYNKAETKLAKMPLYDMEEYGLNGKIRQVGIVHLDEGKRIEIF